MVMQVELWTFTWPFRRRDLTTSWMRRMAERTAKMGYVGAMLPSGRTWPQPCSVLQQPKGYSVPSR